MKNIHSHKELISHYDIVICGGGVAGLWLLNVLTKEGFDVLLLEKESLGGIQTIASQGMIHGGQRYMLGNSTPTHAESVAQLPKRWDACLEGRGELDLSDVRVLSEKQVMWSIGGSLTRFALSTASHMLKAKTRKLEVQEVPEVLADLAGLSVYELPEKVLDVASLVEALSTPHRAKIRKGSVDELSLDGCLTVAGFQIKAQVVICAAGLGNEELLKLLDSEKGRTQRRPLRQLMVKPMPLPLYGHGITTSYKPSVTVTSHPLLSGGYVWYLGGALADDALSLSDNDAIAFAKKEMKQLFGHLDWSGKQWATWYGFRAEAYSHNGRLPTGPVLQEYGNALVIWPTKLTLAPLLGDKVIARLVELGVRPKHSGSPSSLHNLPLPPLAQLPWDQADWSCY
jgi:glycine/D-amino acid oxidase-like deaminating enzyme